MNASFINTICERGLAIGKLTAQVLDKSPKVSGDLNVSNYRILTFKGDLGFTTHPTYGEVLAAVNNFPGVAPLKTHRELLVVVANWNDLEKRKLSHVNSTATAVIIDGDQYFEGGPHFICADMKENGPCFSASPAILGRALHMDGSVLVRVTEN